jgi:hypothetical protein
MVALLNPQRESGSRANINVYLPISGEALLSMNPAAATRLCGTSHELTELHISTHERRNFVIDWQRLIGARDTMKTAPFEPCDGH